MDVSLGELQELVLDREAWLAVIHEVTKSRTLLSDWSDLMEKTLESPLDRKEIKPVNSEENYTEYSLEGLMLKLKLQ